MGTHEKDARTRSVHACMHVRARVRACLHMCTVGRAFKNLHPTREARGSESPEQMLKKNNCTCMSLKALLVFSNRCVGVSVWTVEIKQFISLKNACVDLLASISNIPPLGVGDPSLSPMGGGPTDPLCITLPVQKYVPFASELAPSSLRAGRAASPEGCPRRKKMRQAYSLTISHKCTTIYLRNLPLLAEDSQLYVSPLATRTRFMPSPLAGFADRI